MNYDYYYVSLDGTPRMPARTKAVETWMRMEGSVTLPLCDGVT